MASIQINRGTKAEIDNTPIVDGLISFQTDDNFIYMDNGETREAFGGVKVIPNPEEQPTEVLRNLQIADDVYKISGGHEIEDQSGDTLTQRDKMRFTGAYSHDDSTNEVTKIDIVREMTVSQKDSLSGDEIEGFQWTTDENDELPLTTDWVEYRNGQSATEAIDKCIKQVIDDGGDDLTQRENIQFVGVYTSDDSTNNKTDVQIVREFQSVAEIEALTGEAKKGFEVIEDTEEYIPYTGSDILFDNTDTSFEGENVQEVLEEVDGKIDDIDLTNGGTVDGSLAIGKSTSADTYLSVGSPTSKGIFSLTNNDKVASIEADTLTANRAIKVPNNSGTIALTNNLSAGVIGTGNTILSKLSDTSIPIGMSVWGTQNAEDSPQKGTVSFSFMMKATYGGLYSSVYMFVNGNVYYAQTGSSLPSSLSWSRIV